MTDALTVEGVVPPGVAGVDNKVAPAASVDAGVGETKGVVGAAAGSHPLSEVSPPLCPVAGVLDNSDAGDMEVRVPMWERDNNRMRKRNGWPKRKNLKRYLAANPQCVVYEAQDCVMQTIPCPWECLACTVTNRSEVDVCHSCQSPRGTPAAPPAPPPPTFGACSSLSTIAEESGFNSGVALRVKELLPHYPCWLRARGDGNCFYRSLYMALLDFHCRGGDGGKALQGFLASVVDIDLTQSELHLAAQGTCAAYLSSLVADPVPLDPISWREDRILDFIKDPSLDEALVVVLRALAARQLMQNYQLDDDWCNALHRSSWVLFLPRILRQGSLLSWGLCRGLGFSSHFHGSWRQHANCLCRLW